MLCSTASGEESRPVIYGAFNGASDHPAAAALSFFDSLGQKLTDGGKIRRRTRETEKGEREEKCFGDYSINVLQRRRKATSWRPEWGSVTRHWGSPTTRLR
ncbi:hypothetical protein GWI33_000047 [Rhynchophorus ferrugineus]|uniref:Uncharacterized protein n=1 Tax=Rhynchophorus ferrugineus TaxID=354439 RepID=A0A834IW03_RHYFE|nr:hypothetical protein GWI33_000047 [Rhynchophorus ferrugineus]